MRAIAGVYDFDGLGTACKNIEMREFWQTGHVVVTLRPLHLATREECP